jgi:uncharacterized membrane protein
MPRIQHLDLARGFTVFIMPSVHVVMLYSHPTVQQSLLGEILRFLAEGPGAQLFMLLMGISIALSNNLSPKKVLQRTFYLAAGAFLLNLYKLVIPNELGLLPLALLQDLDLHSRTEASSFFFFMGDIFHFAAIAYPVTYAISLLKYYRYWSALFAIAIMLLSPLIWDVKMGLSFVDGILAYFNGQPPAIYFPVFPWLVYPLAGLCIRKYVDSTITSLTGILFIVLSLFFPATNPYSSHYRSLPADTLFHIGLVFVWLSIFRWFSNKIKMNILFKLLLFCSRHISVIYILQWLLIFWCLPLAGYSTLNLPTTLFWMTGMTFITLLLTKLFVHGHSPKSV